MALTPAEWFDAAHEAYVEVLRAVGRHGVTPDPELAFVPADAPTPYYEPATKTIGIGMPDPATIKGRLYWLYAARVLGYGGVDEAVARQAEQMPFMIAHELAHHLRQHYGAPNANDFAEEQVANAIALAFVHEHPVYRARLPAMREAASRATLALAALVPEATPHVGGFRLSSEDGLVDQDRMSAAELRELEAVADLTGVALDELLVEAGVVSAADLSAAATVRERAEAYFNAGYMANLLEYGYFHMTWIAAYLGRDDPPSLAEAIDDYLLTPDWERSRQKETTLLVRQLLRDAPGTIGPAVAEALTEQSAPELVPPLVDALAVVPPPAQAAILLGLARYAPDDPRVREAARSRSESADPAVRAASAVVLQKSGAGASVGREVVGALLLSEDAADQAGGLTAAAALADPALIDGLVRCLRSGPPHIRLLALEAIEALPPDPALGGWLPPAAAEPDGPVRQATARCLGRHLAAGQVSSLVALLDDPVDAVRREAASSLMVHGATAIPAILESVAPSWRARTERALLLHRLGDQGAAPLVADLEAELTAAARALARLRPPPHPGSWPRAQVLEGVLAEQVRHLCLLALRVVAAQRPGQAMDQALAGLRWDDPSTRAALLGLARRALPSELLAVLEGHPPTGPEAVSPLGVGELGGLLPAFDPALADLAAACIRPSTTEGETVLSDMEKLLFLRTIPLFRDVELVDLRRLGETCETSYYRADELVFDQGETGDRLFVVTAGRVAVERTGTDGSTVRLRELGSGASFGETALFSDLRRTAAVRALVDSTLLGLRRAPVLQAGLRHPSVLLAIVRVMSERMAGAGPL